MAAVSEEGAVGEVSATNVILLRKMHRKTTQGELRAVAEQFGRVLSIHVWYGFGKAIVEMGSNLEATAFIEAYRTTPLRIKDKEIILAYGIPPRDDQRAKEDKTNPKVIAKACRRLVEDLVRVLEEKDRRRNANLLRERHNKLVAEVRRGVEGRQVRADVCWEWVCSGRCYRGEGCTYKHEVVPISDLPARFRWFTKKDPFPNSRQISPYKSEMNAILARLADSVPNPRSLVLDGSACNSVLSVTGGLHGRGPGDITVPNNCTETYLKIRDSGLCDAYFGSVRALLDSRPQERYGYVYLDYCCSISAGRTRVEKSPVGDISAFFRNRQFDEGGCVLCVTLAEVDQPARRRDGSDESSEGEAGSDAEEALGVAAVSAGGSENDAPSGGARAASGARVEGQASWEAGGLHGEASAVAPHIDSSSYAIPTAGDDHVPGAGADAQLLRSIVSTEAARAGAMSLAFHTSFSWPGNFSEVFYIASPSATAAYLSQKACPFVKRPWGQEAGF